MSTGTGEARLERHLAEALVCTRNGEAHASGTGQGLEPRVKTTFENVCTVELEPLSLVAPLPHLWPEKTRVVPNLRVARVHDDRKQPMYRNSQK